MIDGFFSRPSAGASKTEIELFRGALDEYKKNYQIEMYEGAVHAFLPSPSSEHAVNREAAGKLVVRTVKRLRKALA
jgi:dienelactone hydrolase